MSFSSISTARKSDFSLDADGKLLRNVITSKVLISEGTSIEDSYIRKYMRKNIDYPWLDRKKFDKILRHGFHEGSCPNFYLGSQRRMNREIFYPSTSISVRIKQQDEPLIISLNDLETFKTSTTAGAFGSIFFLKNMKFEHDYLSLDNNRGLKSDLVIKKQTRETKFGTALRGDTCYAFNELYMFLINKLRTDEFHSDQYIDHFYAPSTKDPNKFDLYIIMKRCDLMVSELIDLVHGKDRKLAHGSIGSSRKSD